MIDEHEFKTRTFEAWVKHREATAQPLSLEAALLELAKYGHPWVWLSSKGWVSHCDMNTATAGGHFTIKSNDNRATPLSAATQCLERVKAVVKDAK